MQNDSISRRLKRTNFELIIMLLPGIVALMVFSYIPIAGIIVAFKSVDYSNTIWNAPWCGLDNFKFLFSTPDAWLITRNTLLYNFVFIGLGAVLNVGVAVLLSELYTRRLAKAYQNILFLPHLFSMVIVSYLVYGFLSNDYGWMNTHLLPMLGIKPIDWYNTVGAWPFILIFVKFWASTGYGSILYISGMAGIDPALYESAEIDGAGRWQKLIYITLPSLSPILIVNIILGLGNMFRGDFGLFYNVTMNSSALYPVTNVIDTYIYRALLVTGDTGISSAGAFYQSVMGFITILAANMIVKKIDPEKSFF